MGKEIVKIQNFSSNPCIKYGAEKSGFYNLEAVVNVNNSLNVIITPYQYIEPENIFNLDDKIENQDFIRRVELSHKKSAFEAFKAIIQDQKFDFLYFPSNERRLFILCPSAIIRGKFLVPYFYRWSWARDGVFPGNVLVVSDPTFDVDNRIEAGWFVGNKDRDGTRNFCDIIRIFNKILKIPYRETIFWGSSAGGFTAIQMSKYFPHSSAVAVNSQVDIDKTPWFENLYKIVFNGLTREEINLYYNDRLRLAPNLEKLKSNKIIMVQNTQDKSHYNEHFLPFASIISDTGDKISGDGFYTRNNFILWVYSHPDGHMAETPEMAKKIIDLLLNPAS